MNIQHLRLRQKRINELEETLKHEHGWKEQDLEEVGLACTTLDEYLFQLDKAAGNEKTMA